MTERIAIEVQNLSYSYYNSNLLLDNVSFSIPEKTIVTVLGKNGVGKTTLLNCLLGLIKQYKGTIRVFDREIKEYTRKELACVIGLVPQLSQVSFEYTVEEFVLLGVAPQIGYFSIPSNDAQKSVDHALNLLGIRNLKYRFVNSLSGGERQLAYIARAIVQNPKIIVMDEPTSALDFGNSLAITELICRLRDDGYTIILSCHNPDFPFAFHGYTIAMFPGKKVIIGESDELLSDSVLSDLYGIAIKRVRLPESKQFVCVKK